jgi:hypothetical protein
LPLEIPSTTQPYANVGICTTVVIIHYIPEALDEYYTMHLPITDPSKSGVTTRYGFRMIALDRLSEDYLLTKAIVTHKIPTEIIGELVREKIAYLEVALEENYL